MFAPAINPLVPSITQLVNEQIDTFESKGECVLDEELGVPLPTKVFLTLMGLPLEDSPYLLELKDGVLRPGYREGIDPSDTAAIEAIGDVTAQRIYDYFQAFLDERRATPSRDDIMGQVLAADVDGRRLSDEELLDACFLLLIAGLDTITNSLGLFFFDLAQRPDLRARARRTQDWSPPPWRSFSDGRRRRRRFSGWRRAILRCAGSKSTPGS